MSSSAPPSSMVRVARPVGKLLYASSSWLCKPLCRRYLLAEFNVVYLPINSGSATEQSHWRWALGTFRQAEYEVLGAWPQQVPLAVVLDELHERGIERIEACRAGAGEDFACRFPDAVHWPRTHEQKTDLTPAHLHRFTTRRWTTLQAGVATAEFVQLSLERSIKRHAPFADEGAAVAFLMQALESADRQVQGLPRARSTRPRRSQAGPDARA